MTLGVEETNFKTCILKNASEENLLSIIEHNLNSLDGIIDYNIENNIKLFRISSGIIPFGSSPANNLPWWDLFQEKLSAIGSKINDSSMRVSMHPGQYTVLNSPREEVVVNAVKDLEYHTAFLDSLNVSKESKIILHVGGVYGDKNEAINRFIENYKVLDKKIKNRLVIENDDKSYTIEEVLPISRILNIPVIYDNLHNQVLPADIIKDDKYWIKEVNKTWAKEDGLQKIHYSQQDPIKREGAHSFTITLSEFMDFKSKLEGDLDIMLEVKDKNLSAIKCIHALEKNNIKTLEIQWSKYKYSILERSPQNYKKIRELLKDKGEYPVFEFYHLIEESLAMEENSGYQVNAFQHIWGYFKDRASESEKKRFEKMLVDYLGQNIKSQIIKNFLNRLTIKYNSEYLRESYYFSI